jgi:DNA helicase-2/ATP-dependent DNA helicase PcrA
LSDLSQARLVVRRIEDLLQEHLPHEIAVLFRAGFHSYQLELALNQASIPFRKYGGLRYTEAAHVKDVMAYVRLLLNPLDMPAFARVAAQHHGIGPKTVEKLYAAAARGDAKITGKAFARFPGLLEDLRFVDGLRAAPQAPAATLGMCWSTTAPGWRPSTQRTGPAASRGWRRLCRWPQAIRIWIFLWPIWPWNRRRKRATTARAG